MKTTHFFPLMYFARRAAPKAGPLQIMEPGVSWSREQSQCSAASHAPAPVRNVLGCPKICELAHTFL
jgi:hypothetical protein